MCMKIIDLAIMLILYFALFFNKWKRRSINDLVINALLYFYFMGYLYFTLMPIITSLPFIFNHPYNSMNLVLFDDLFKGRGDYLRQIVLNVILTIPFGYLISFKVKKINLIKVVLYTFLLSFVTELLQPLICSRSADITDLFTNIVGGIIGYLGFIISKPLINRFIYKKR